MTAVSDRLCRFVAELPEDQLPPETLAAACSVLLDAVGVMLGASGLSEEAAPFIRLAAAQGTGRCAILGTGSTTSPAMAAFANGALAHALDYEDAFDRAPGHPNASLVPALIALAQAERPVSGLRFLAALALGCEVSCRLALALRTPMEQGGWYSPPILAGLGAAAGAARLLGFDATGVRDALSLAMGQLATPGEIKHSPASHVRAIREAFPAQAAVQAALLARDGVRGYEQPLEGKSGFYALFAGGNFDAAALVGNLGDSFCIEELTFKPWPSCRGTHAAIELALASRQRHAIDPAAIAKVEVEHDAIQSMLCQPIDRKRAPATVIDAKFSIPFCTALALVDGKVDLDSFRNERLVDPALLAMAARVGCTLSPDRSKVPGSGGGVTIILRDGCSFSAQADNALGCPERPLSHQARLAKFLDCAGRARMAPDQAKTEAMAAAILSLADCGDVGALFDPLRITP